MAGSSAASKSPEGDLPFADPSDVLEVDTLFTGEEISSWAHKAVRPKSKTTIPVPKRELKPKSEPPTKQRPPALPRRRLRHQLAKPFAYKGVAMAPAARSGMRFNERTDIRDEGLSWKHWPVIVSTIAATAIAIWMMRPT